MKETEVTLELDFNSVEYIRTLAKDKAKTVEEEVTYLLEKGVEITEGNEQGWGRTLASDYVKDD